MYDRFFSSGKSGLNKIVYKALFTSEVLAYSKEKEQLPQASTLTKTNSNKQLYKKNDGIKPISA